MRDLNLRPDMMIRRPNPPKITPELIREEANPVTTTDADLYSAEPHPLTALPVVIHGSVQTQTVPTVSAGSGNATLNTATAVQKIGSKDPRRATLTIFTNQPTYVSNSMAQVQTGTAALIPSNVGVVISHRDDIWIGGPATNTFPMTVAFLIENWAY
jgi:hypothetical protein